jgi:hypothetical protein
MGKQMYGFKLFWIYKIIGEAYRIVKNHFFGAWRAFYKEAPGFLPEAIYLMFPV